MNYHWHWAVFFDPSPEGNFTYGHMMLLGLWTTLQVAALAWIIALSLGLIAGVARTLPGWWPRTAAAIHVELFRNIPLLVQLFLWYFVLPELVPTAFGDWLKQRPDAAFLTAVIGIGAFMSARIAEQIRAGIAAIPRGQAAAARAHGLTLPQTYRYVLLPMALRIILPPLTSELINTIKNPSVALTIGLAELTARARAVQEFSFQVFEAFAAATLGYLIINLIATLGMRWIEQRTRVPGMATGS